VVEDAVAVAAHLGAPGERRIGVEDGRAVAQEEAEARVLERLLLLEDPVEFAGLRALEVGPGAEVDLQRRLRLVDGGVEVVVEVAAVRREEGERPAAFLLVGGDLLVGGPGHDGVGRGPGAEVRQQPGRKLVAAGGGPH
jgi:hypothetical protein